MHTIDVGDPYYTTLIGLASFFLGALVGHRLNLGRERRNKFNDVAQRVYATLWGHGSISADDLRLFKNTIGPWRRRPFRKALAAYKAECAHAKYDPRYGTSTHPDPAAVHRARQRLISFTKLR